MDTRILKEMNHIHPSLINNTNLTILIGISPNKCGSSYIHQVIAKSLNALRIENYQGVEHVELNYWDRCIFPDYVNYKIDDHCGFNGYLHRFVDNITELNMHRQIIFFEKSSAYIRFFHSSYLLSHYAHFYNLFFYVSLRNPSHRTWSQYWMDNTHKDKYDRKKSGDVHKMAAKIEHDMELFASHYPKYGKLMNYFKISGNSSRDIDEGKVVNLYIGASYDVINNLNFDFIIDGHHNPYFLPAFMISCYYPQILMWYHTFNTVDKGNTHKQKMRMSDRIKIFQFEWIFEDGIQNIMKAMFTWVDNKSEPKVVKYFDSHDNEYFENEVTKRSSFIPKKIKLDDLPLKSKLDAMFRDCNLRLYWFLQEHPDLLLFANRSFAF